VYSACASGHSCSSRQTFSPITKIFTGGFLQDPRVDAFEVIVEPAQLSLVQFDTGIGVKVDIPGIA
jgi:hypothetical protein